MVYKLIIFDLDGTIIKFNSTVREVIRRFDKLDWAERTALRLIGLTPPGSVLRQDAIHTIETCSGEYEPIVEVVNFIKYTPNYKMAICSSNSRRFIRKCLREIKILERFISSLIVSGEDVRILKPNPEGLKMILERSRVYPHEAIYFGGGHNDLLTAKNAQITFISLLDYLKWVLWQDYSF